MRILLADDDKEDHFIMDDAFREIGAPGVLAFAENGEGALSYLEECFLRSGLPSLVILDLNMPKMNGTQTLRLLKSDERFRKIPVVIYSTSLNTFERNECLLLGAEAYIIKPVTFTECVRSARDFYSLAQSAATAQA